MKVLHVLNELKFSGAEIMYVDAASVFQRLGCELYVVNTAKSLGEYSKFFEKAGYKVLHKPWPRGFWKQYVYCKKFAAFLKEEGVDVVHIHRADIKFFMSYCAWKAKCKSIYTFHNVFKPRWYSYFLRFCERLVSKHIFGCTFQTISDSVYENEKKCFYNDTIKIYNWYGSNRFYPAYDGEKNKIRLEIGIPVQSLVITSVGGCSPVKRHTDIIKALPLVIKEYPNVVYLHLGDGRSLQEEIQLAKNLNVSDHIRFCGNQSDVRKFLIASDIYVMPSRYEGIPITTIECMACRIPAILYNVPGLCDFNKEKNCSALIPEDYQVLAQTIIELYGNKSHQEVIVNNAADFVNKYFNMENNATRIFQLYLKS